MFALSVSGEDDALAERLLREAIRPTAAHSCIYVRVALARLFRRQGRVVEGDHQSVFGVDH